MCVCTFFLVLKRLCSFLCQFIICLCDQEYQLFEIYNRKYFSSLALVEQFCLFPSTSSVLKQLSQQQLAKSSLLLVVASGQLVISQTSSLIVIVEQNNFPFYTVLIRLEIAELDRASYSQLQLVVASEQLVISQIPCLIVLVKQTNFPLYTVLIRLEIAELDLASYSQLQLVYCQGLAKHIVLLYLLSRTTYCFTPF